MNDRGPRGLDRQVVAIAAAALGLPPVAMAVLALSGLAVPAIFAEVWLVAVGIVGCLAFIDRSDRRAGALIAAGAIVLRLALGAVLLTFFRAELFRSFDDAPRYLDIGSQIAAGWRAGQPVDLYGIYSLTVAGYYYIVAAVQYVVGPDLLVVICFNAAVASVTGGAVYRLARELGASSRERLVAMGIASYAPSVLFWSALPLKDTPITLLLVVGLLAALALLGRRRLIALVTLLACMALMSWFRLYATLFLSLAAATVLVMQQRAFRRVPLWAALVVLLVGAVQIWTLQSPVGQQVTLAATDLNELQRQRDIFDRGASSQRGAEPISGWEVIPGVFATASAAPASTAPTPPARSPSPSAAPSGSPSPPPSAAPSPSATLQPPQAAADRAGRYLELALEEPRLMLQFLTLPIPFVTHGTLVSLALPEMIVWYLALPVALAGLVLLYRRRPMSVVVIVLVTLAMAFIYGTLVGNAGSLMRYRSQTIVLLAIPIAAGVQAMFRRYWRP